MKHFCLKIHRWLAISFGVFIFIICITGAILVYQTEIQKALNSDLYHVEVPAGAKMLPDKELAAKILDQLDDGQSITFIQLSDKEGDTAQVNIAGMGQKNLFVNPYTGEVLGYPRYTGFFDGVKSLHRWLFNKPEKRQGGKSVMEFCHQDTQAQVGKQNPEDVNVMHISQSQQNKGGNGGFHMLMSSTHTVAAKGKEY